MLMKIQEMMVSQVGMATTFSVRGMTRVFSGERHGGGLVLCVAVPV